jgi:hypothetical protein
MSNTHDTPDSWTARFSPILTGPTVCHACFAAVRTMHEHAPACVILSGQIPPPLRPWEQTISEHGLDRMQRLQAVDLIVEGESRRLRRGHMSGAAFMLLWGNGYWRPVAADHLLFMTRWKTLAVSTSVVLDSITDTDHPTPSVAALRAAALVDGEMEELMTHMDDEATQLLVDCIVHRIDGRSDI